ncbi:MAG TPA: hypothetical protein VG537_08635, partial [Candidatus Kapabacteria bacterium]|nr:hypothetical protein [Candidatus Kapabacteria bacterium]
MRASFRVHPYVSLFFVIVFGQLLSSCSQSSNPSNVQHGSLTGVVSLGSEDASSPQQLANSAGVSISLDGTGYSTTSDSSGFWEFNDL